MVFSKMLSYLYLQWLLKMDLRLVLQFYGLILLTVCLNILKVLISLLQEDQIGLLKKFVLMKIEYKMKNDASLPIRKLYSPEPLCNWFLQCIKAFDKRTCACSLLREFVDSIKVIDWANEARSELTNPLYNRSTILFS